MDKSMVSIIAPYYNTPREWLFECIESVFKQEYRDWELIIVDDFSKQRTEELELPCFGSDNKIQIIRHERNKGLAAARNTGISAASGEYILPLDTDDMLDPRFLDVTMKMMMADEKVDSVFTDFRLIGFEQGVWKNSVRPAIDMIINQSIPGPGVLYRKKIWISVGGYCEEDVFRRGNEDWDFWMGAVKNGLTVRHVGEPLYIYRRNLSSMSNSILKSSYHLTIERMYERHRAFIDSYGLKNEFLFNGYIRTIGANNSSDVFILFFKALKKCRSIKCLFLLLKVMIVRIISRKR